VRTITVHIIVAGLLAAYVGWLVVSRRLPGGTPLDVPVLAFLGVYVLATLNSISWRVSLEPTLQIASAIVIFYALADLPLLTAQSLRRALLLAGGAMSIYALWVVG